MQDFQTSYRGPVCVVSLPRRVDLTNTRHLVDAVQREIAAGCRFVVLDLATTDSIDSTALGAIVHLFRSLGADRGAFALAGVCDTVRRLLAMTRLDRVFAIFPTVDDAVAGQVAPGPGD